MMMTRTARGPEGRWELKRQLKNGIPTASLDLVGTITDLLPAGVASPTGLFKPKSVSVQEMHVLHVDRKCLE